MVRKTADNYQNYEEYLLCVLEQEYTSGKTIRSREKYDKPSTGCEMKCFELKGHKQSK